MRSEDNLDHESNRRSHSVPRPTLEFRRRSWRVFQRALDPFGPLRPLQRRPR